MGFNWCLWYTYIFMFVHVYMCVGEHACMFMFIFESIGQFWVHSGAAFQMIFVRTLSAVPDVHQFSLL